MLHQSSRCHTAQEKIMLKNNAEHKHRFSLTQVFLPVNRLKSVSIVIVIIYLLLLISITIISQILLL